MASAKKKAAKKVTKKPTKKPARPADATFADFVVEQLASLRGLDRRPMFGGHGLYLDGTFFAIVHRGRLYFRVSDATRTEYEERGMKPFMPGAKQMLKRYYEVPPEVLEDAREVAAWARAAAKAGGQLR